MLDITSLIKPLSTPVVRIRKYMYLDGDNKGKWKHFFATEPEKLGGALDLNDMQQQLAKNLSPFLKEIFKIWSELNYQLRLNIICRVLPHTKFMA